MISPISYTGSTVVRTYVVLRGLVCLCIAGSIGECCESVRDHLGPYILSQ